MIVKELITELLEFNLDTEVEIGIESTHEDNNFESFGFEETRHYLSLVVKLKDYVLVDKRDFEDMQKEIEELKNQIEELEEEQND